MEKLEWCGYQMVKKFRRYLFVLAQFTSVTNGQTDGRTVGQRMPVWCDRIAPLKCLPRRIFTGKKPPRGKHYACKKSPPGEFIHGRNLWGRIYNSPPLLKIRHPIKKSPHPLKILPYLNALVLKWEIFTM